MPKLPTPRHTTVVAYLALFVALGGTSVAAVSLGGEDVRDGSLTGRDVRNNSITGRDMRNNSITGRDVRSLRGGDVINNSLTGRDIHGLRRGDFQSGALTPNSRYVTKTFSSDADGGGAVGVVACPSGTALSGGGYSGVDPGKVTDSFPGPQGTNVPTAWVVQVQNAAPNQQFQVFAVCQS